MSLAVEQTLPHRQLDMDRPRSACHAAESFKFNASPSVASSRDETDLATPSSHNNRSSYDSMHRQFYDDMEDHRIMAAQPADQKAADEAAAPVLPQKSALRASRLLDNLTSLKMPASTERLSFTQDPHDEYLSSEEEASSTAGDFSDFEYDSSSDDISPSPVKECATREVTARVVSVIFSGKPVVVDVPQVRRSFSPSSMERPKSATAAFRQSSYDEVKESLTRRPSVSTVSSRSSRSSRPSSLRPQVAHPPRSSSMQPLGATKPAPFFLKIDPYANGSTYSLDAHHQQQQPQPKQPHRPQSLQLQQPQQPQLPQQSTPTEEDRPKTPRTPGKMFKGVARAMSLMKRRSTPRLNQSYLASPSIEYLPRSGSPSDRSIPEEPTEESPVEQPAQTQEQTESQSPQAEPTTVPPPPSRPPPPPEPQPLTHDDIVRMATRNERASRQLSASRTFHEGQPSTLEAAQQAWQTRSHSPPAMAVSPVSPMVASPNTGGKRMSSFGFGRRRMSVKLTGVKFQP